jgi:hypothetical protein
MINYISEILKSEWFLVLTTGCSGLFMYIAKSQYDSWKKKKEEVKEVAMIDGMKSFATVYSCMSNITSLGNVGRVFLLEVSDSGEIVKPGSKLFARGIDIFIDDWQLLEYGNPEAGRDWNINKFSEVKVDDNYARMVIQAKATQQPYVFDVEKHEDCTLKSIYVEQGIVYSEIYHIYSDTNCWKEYILSISAYSKEIKEQKGFSKAVIENNIEQIRYNFKKYR